MAEEVEMTPIAPEEGGSVPPKVSPFAAGAPAPAAPAAPSPAPAAPATGTSTVKLKPVIRKPMIHKPTIGAKPPPMPTPAAPAAKKATQNLKSVTGPIPVQATLKKTGIIAEGIITPQQQQAAKSKTSRISLESAIGVAPVKEGPAPLKTIRLRRPTDLKPQGPSPLVPKAPESAPAPVAPVAAAPAPVAPAAEAADDASLTQKKTLKLHRPGGVGIKHPTIGPKPAVEAGVGDLPAVEGGDVPEMAPLAPMNGFSGGEAADDNLSAGVPNWVVALSLVTTLAALIAIGLAMYFLWLEGAGPVAGANEMQFLQM